MARKKPQFKTYVVFCIASANGNRMKRKHVQSRDIESLDIPVNTVMLYFYNQFSASNHEHNRSPNYFLNAKKVTQRDVADLYDNEFAKQFVGRSYSDGEPCETFALCLFDKKGVIFLKFDGRRGDQIYSKACDYPLDMD